jgi:transcriptional regulator with XRE-family HTH domain
MYTMAKSVKAFITPEVLKWARERRIRLELDYAAKKLKIDPERLEAWENGTAQPTFAQLKKIAKLYKTHISIFYLPKPPTDFRPLTDYRVLPGVSVLKEEETYRLNANIVEVFDRRQTLIELYELLEEPPPKVTLKSISTSPPSMQQRKLDDFLISIQKNYHEPKIIIKF